MKPKKIITQRTAEKLIREGRATLGSALRPDEKGRIYVAIDRCDIQMVQHFTIKTKRK